MYEVPRVGTLIDRKWKGGCQELGEGERLKGGALVQGGGAGEGEEFEGRGFGLGGGESLGIDVVTAAQD